MNLLKSSSLSVLFLLAILSTVLLSCAPSRPAHGGGPTWVRLGDRMVDFRGDHDEIIVTGIEGTFTALKLKVNSSPIFLNNVVIHFGDGATHVWPVNRRINQGTETRPLDLPGGKRIIKKVVLNYRTAPKAVGKAHIVLFGRR